MARAPTSYIHIDDIEHQTKSNKQFQLDFLSREPKQSNILLKVRQTHFGVMNIAESCRRSQKTSDVEKKITKVWNLYVSVWSW